MTHKRSGHESSKPASAPPAIAGTPTLESLVPEPDHAWKALTLVNDWVKHAETKAATTLAGAGVAGGVLYNLVKNQSQPGLALSVTATICGAASILAGLTALAALAPKLKIKRPRSLNPLKIVKLRAPGSSSARPAPSHDEQPTAVIDVADADKGFLNLLFFGDISRAYADDGPSYAQVLATLTTDPTHITQHIALQVHANSFIANRKYGLANIAIRALRVALIALAATAIIVGSY